MRVVDIPLYLAHKSLQLTDCRILGNHTGGGGVELGFEP